MSTQLTKEQVLSQFNWITNKSGTGNSCSDADLSLTITVENNRNKQRYNFSIRNSFADAFANKRVQFAIYKNRLMFRFAEQGYKVTKRDKKVNAYMCLTATEENEALKAFAGEHSLKYDEFLEVYYIEKPAKPRAYISESGEYV